MGSKVVPSKHVSANLQKEKFKALKSEVFDSFISDISCMFPEISVNGAVPFPHPRSAMPRASDANRKALLKVGGRMVMCGP